jgi:hypothetical protein
MSIEDPNDQMMFAALYQSILPGGALMNNFIRKQPSTLDDLMNKVEEFINLEESLKAMANSR